MNFSKLKKYISWNIISAIGYIGLIIFIFFLIIRAIGLSNINMRADLNEYYTDFVTNHIIKPYYAIYKFQISIIIFLMIGSLFEHHKNIENNLTGFQPFESYKIRKIYSIFFYIGILLNLVPLYIPFLEIISLLVKFCGIIIQV